MKTKPEMTDDEIHSYMDFDQLLELHQNPVVRQPFMRSKYFIIAATVVSIGMLYWFYTFNYKTSTRASDPETANASRQEKNTQVVDSAVNKIEQPSTSESETPKGTGNVQPKQNSTKSKQSAADEQLTKQSLKPVESQGKVGDELVYVQAAPINGYPDLYEYFNRELKYPAEAVKDSIQGEVVAVFTINHQGLPENIIIEQSLGELFDKEVLRLIKNMPPWKPASYNNKPVASRLSLPLTFQLDKIVLNK